MIKGTMLAIQCITPATLRAAGEADAHWTTLPPEPGVDYSSYPSVAAHAALLELDADGGLVYRLVEVGPARDLGAEDEAYLLLERVATATANDTDVTRLDALSRELDRAAVPYRGWR